MSFLIDPAMLYALHYAPDGDDPADVGGGGGDPVDPTPAGDPQAIKDPADPAGDPDPADPADPADSDDKLPPELEEVVQRRAARMAEEKEAARVAALEAEEEDSKFDARILETEGKVEDSLRQAAGKVVANAAKLRFIGEDGEPVALSTKQIDELIFAPLNEHLALHGAAMAEEMADEYSAAFLETMPVEAHESYLKATVDKQLTPAAHAAAFAEAMAPNTKAWRAREGAWQDEKAEAVAAATTKGFEAGKANPGQMATQQGTKATGQRLTAERFMKMTPDERADAWTTNPEEVRAL